VTRTEHPWCTPKRKRTRWVRPSERGGQVISSPLPIHLSGNLRLKKSVTSLYKSGGAPSCWYSMPSGPSSSKIDTRNSSTWGTVSTTVSAALQVERFGNSSGTNYKLDHITNSNTFSFHSSAFRFMSNVTVKWYTFVNISCEHTVFSRCFKFKQCGVGSVSILRGGLQWQFGLINARLTCSNALQVTDVSFLITVNCRAYDNHGQSSWPIPVTRIQTVPSIFMSDVSGIVCPSI
jgi:hypothetical protein